MSYEETNNGEKERQQYVVGREENLENGYLIRAHRNVSTARSIKHNTIFSRSLPLKVWNNFP